MAAPIRCPLGARNGPFFTDVRRRPKYLCARSDGVNERFERCGEQHGLFRPLHVGDVSEALASPLDWFSEVRARENATLPGTGEAWA